MKNVVLLIGGNLGDRLSLIEEAENLLGKLFVIVQRSQIYETTAWGGESEGDYLNRILIIKTEMKPETVLRYTQDIEDILERTRSRKWGNRTMDIDILYIDGEVINTPLLAVPHPLIQERKFALVPLAELLPDFKHPLFGKSSRQLLDECKDMGEVNVYRP
ncbi:2-amino-4-hydroxy-6-hydroxymethyldihydropteridine diphosphokinase [Anditalea andensis]|uniref:2-amino-4-hydroxy-6-hydroxymethyldihydropteridine pyrophosphokinase n=1 Tax=Anditalea andensis TaxID=1048983 RepID=A0A074L2J4_9BACT|nr:2-amino-4-hydroxy-6-hydroxymethyldihydropteridine diphosphokinase [Anditalea andensis]KEO74675.1 2-amino-4-hydroxy-6-hydroxymethyldihydropteridine pyrophosphokinase [Anditalea andensis]